MRNPLLPALLSIPLLALASAAGAAELEGRVTLVKGSREVKGVEQTLITEIEIPSGEAVEVRLKVTKPQVPRHTNKLGLPYARKRSGRGYR